MAQVGTTVTHSLIGVVLPVHGPKDSRRTNWALNAPGRTTASCVIRRQLSGSCRSSSSGAEIFSKSKSFLGGASLSGAVHGSALSLSNLHGGNFGSRTVCLFGRRRKNAPCAQQEPDGASQRMEVRERTVPVEGRDRTVPVEVQERTVSEAGRETAVPVAGRERTVPVVGQAVQFAIEHNAKNPTASAFLVAVVCAGFVLLAMKVVTFLRGGYLRKELARRRQAAFAGPEEEAEALVQARARLAQAFGDQGAVQYKGKITRMQVVSMMDSAADYLYALANEVAETKGELDDKKERLALALQKSKQDADERKELIRRISMAEAELVEAQLKQAADKAAAASREKNLKEELASEMDELVTMHRAALEDLQSQLKEKEREEGMAAAAMKKMTEDVQTLKQGLKEKEAKLAEATRRAEEESELNSMLSARLETTNSELQAALSRETDLKASLEETATGVEGAELRLEQMQRRHEGEIRAVRGIAQAQAKGLEERLKGAQEKAEEVRVLKDAETAAREQAEARANELQGQVDQLEQDLIFLEAKYKENTAKAVTKPAEESKRIAEIAKLKEALESKTHQADVAKELVLQFVENEREKDFELKQLKREATYAKERLAELERKYEVSVASRIEGALDGPGGSKSGGSGDDGAPERARFEQQLDAFRQDSEAEIAGLRSDLKSARDQLARAQKQHGMEMEAKLGKQERQYRLQISVRESERDGCLVKLGSLEEELALEVQARAQARRELSNAQEQLLEWERRAIEMEASHAAALEAERETSRQKLEALFLDYEKARDEALEKESERVALLQRTEQLQAALAEAKSTRKLQKAKVSEAETAIALQQDIVEEARAKQDRYEAEIETMANEHATLVRSLEDARAAEAAVAEEERNRLENEVALLREQVQAMEATVNEAEAAKLQALAQFAELEMTHAEATQRLSRMSELEKELSLRKQDETLQHELRARIAELDELARSKDDVIKVLKDEKEALATSKDEVIRTLEDEKEALATSKDDVIKSLEVEKEALAKSKVDIVAALEAEKEALARTKDDIIRALEGEKEAVVFEALDRLEEADALTDRVQALLEEQDRALKAFRAEAAAGDEELTRVRQRLAEVEQALAGSQEELRTSKMEEDRLSSELAAAKASSVDLAAHVASSNHQVDGLERALHESHSEVEQLAELEQELRKGLREEAQRREEALRELQERDEVIAFFQRYFEERSLLDVQLYELGRAHSRLKAAKQQLAASTSVHEKDDISSFEADFSSLFQKFEAAVGAATAAYDEREPGSNGIRNGLLEKTLARRGVKENGSVNGLPAPRALELVGVDEVAGTSLADLDGRLFTAEQKAEQLQVEIRQRVVRQMEWQEDEDCGSAELHAESKGGIGGNTKRANGKDGQKESQQLEVQERVSQMMKTLSERLSSGEK